jgi:hypothetical protein
MRFIAILTTIVMLNAMLYLAQYSMLNMNPEATTNFYDYDSSPMKKADVGGYTLNSSIELPTQVASVDVGTSDSFTDTFRTLRMWIKSIPVVGQIYDVLFAFSNILEFAGLDPVISFLLGWVWNIMATVLVINWFKGGE